MGRKPKGSVPAYCRHRRSGRGYVRLEGRQVFLPGEFGSAESVAGYNRTLAEWQANGRRWPLGGEAEAYLVRDLCADYLEHCEVYYRHADGTPTHETDRVALSFRELLRLYGDTPAGRFGLPHLKAVRGAMIRADLCRRNVNDRVGRIVRAFGWAAEELRVPASVYGELRALKRLKRGRSEARETDPVTAVPWKQVEATLPHLPRPVRDMVLVLWWSGMRVSEAVSMRARDIDRSRDDVWAYRPQRHKGSHRGKDRLVGLGPKCIEVLRPYFGRKVPPLSPDTVIFRPADAVSAQIRRQARKRGAHRRGPYSRRDRRRIPVREWSRPPGERYTIDAVRRAVTRACKRAEVDPWSPLQLRHAAGTRIRAEAGLEAARLALGHTDAATTLIYAEEDKERALQIMKQFG